MSAFRKIILWTGQNCLKALKSLGLSVHKKYHLRRGTITPPNDQRGSITTVVTWLDADVQPDVAQLNRTEIADNNWNEKQENNFKY